MKRILKTGLVLTASLLIISGCTEIPTISVGPTSDMQISDALNPNNFLNYRLKIAHTATETHAARVTSASITPDDLLFIIYQDEFTLNDYARYYFDKTGDDQYDVYFYDKEGDNPHNLGYNYYQSFRPSNPNQLVLPQEEITHYYGVFPYTMLTADMFTYRDSKTEFGYYDLNKEEEALILHDFFNLDATNYEINEFSLLIRNKRIYTFEYQVVLKNSTPIFLPNETSSYGNRIDFIYDNLPLETPSSPLINNVELEIIWKDEPIDPGEPDTSTSSEITSSEDFTSSSEIAISLTSEETSSGISSEEITSSEETTSETPSENSLASSSSSDSSSETVRVLDYYRLNFALIKDKEKFQGVNPEYEINDICLYEGRITDFTSQEPLMRNEDITQRYFRLDELPKVAVRYTIQVSLTTTSSTNSEFYFYSFIA